MHGTTFMIESCDTAASVEVKIDWGSGAGPEAEAESGR